MRYLEPSYRGGSLAGQFENLCLDILITQLLQRAGNDKIGNLRRFGQVGA